MRVFYSGKPKVYNISPAGPCLFRFTLMFTPSTHTWKLRYSSTRS